MSTICQNLKNGNFRANFGKFLTHSSPPDWSPQKQSLGQIWGSERFECCKGKKGSQSLCSFFGPNVWTLNMGREGLPTIAWKLLCCNGHALDGLPGRTLTTGQKCLKKVKICLCRGFRTILGHDIFRHFVMIPFLWAVQPFARYKRCGCLARLHHEDTRFPADDTIGDKKITYLILAPDELF